MAQSTKFSAVPNTDEDNQPTPSQRYNQTYSETTTPQAQPRSLWARTGMVYRILFGCLALLIILSSWFIFQKFKDPYSNQDSQGLVFRPLPPPDQPERSLIWIRALNAEDFNYYLDSLNDFLKVYKTTGLIHGRGQNIVFCDYNNPPPPGQVCDIDLKSFAPCTQENHYNYHRSAPCVFLKFNKIDNWVPKYLNESNLLPKKMPQSLVQYIKEIEKTNKPALNTLWVSCEGENPFDIENIGGIEYYPQSGFPGYYFPLETPEGYLGPLVAVHFKRPVRGVVINVECKVWALNLINEGPDNRGSVRFQLLLD